MHINMCRFAKTESDATFRKISPDLIQKRAEQGRRGREEPLVAVGYFKNRK